MDLKNLSDELLKVFSQAPMLKVTANAGIYFLMLGGKVVYVGQAVDIYKRVLDHKSQGVFEFDHYKLMRVEEGKTQNLNVVESLFIWLFQPCYNTSVNGDDIFVHQHVLAKNCKLRLLTGLTAKELRDRMKSPEIAKKRFFHVSELMNVDLKKHKAL